MEKLGKKAKDKVTGFEGTITAKCIYLYGCAQYCIQPVVDKDGKRQQTEWFDEGRIEITGEGIRAESVQAEKPGCEVRDYPN